MADPKSRSAGLDQAFRRQLGRNLRHARLDAGRTLEEVAAHFGLNTNMVWRWEAGRSAPMIDRLVQIAALYGVTPGALLTGVENSTAPSDFTAALEQTAAGLPEEDLDFILDFTRLVRSRRQRLSIQRALPMVADPPAPYAASDSSEEGPHEGPSH